ncbi:MAG: PDZ domain-containing protein [Planctomycetaceae bacterium]|nr:PDZ domain-containing protein [Planctomycetaceae bacterium]
MKITTVVRIVAATVVIAAVTAEQASAQTARMISPEMNQPSTKMLRPELNQPSTRMIRPELNAPSLRLLPSNNCPLHDTPKLGFKGYITRRGMVVTHVLRGTPAWRIGLEPGDVIVSVDGFQLYREGDYERAMRGAGRVVDLEVEDTRGRGVFLVQARLDHSPVYSHHRQVVHSTGEEF